MNVFVFTEIDGMGCTSTRVFSTYKGAINAFYSYLSELLLYCYTEAGEKNPNATHVDITIKDVCFSDGRNKNLTWIPDSENFFVDDCAGEIAFEIKDSGESATIRVAVLED